METRKPVAAGQFYPDSADELRKSIEESFMHRLGPGAMPNDTGRGKNVIAAISPHAGYIYSGMCAAHSFRAIKEAGDFDLFLIIGFSHSGFDREGGSTLALDWETPLGIAEVDKEFVKLLLKETSVAENPMAINNEHSIEVQLPFLQFLYKKFMFVPLSVSHYCDFSKLAKEIRAVVKKTGKRVCYIASSDFTHYGYNFDYVPFKENIKENLKKLDMGAVELIKKLDTGGFLGYLDKTGATICGRSSIALLLELLKDNIYKGELLNYYTSGDIMDDYSHCVSYASIVFEEKK